MSGRTPQEQERTGRDEPDEGGARCISFGAPGRRVAVLAYSPEPECWPDELTPAERDVVATIARGASIDEVAALRGVSAATVTNQLAAMYRKLGVEHRGALLARVYDLVSAGRADATDEGDELEP